MSNNNYEAPDTMSKPNSKDQILHKAIILDYANTYTSINLIKFSIMVKHHINPQLPFIISAIPIVSQHLYYYFM